jgi:hypothetical protein
MDFKLQSFGPFLHWLTLVILCVLPIVAAYLIYRLGGLPGAIARSRNHPQADAINICGWMGLITLVMWPAALVWAHIKPHASTEGNSAIEAEREAMVGKLREAQQRLAALEARLP